LPEAAAPAQFERAKHSEMMFVISGNGTLEQRNGAAHQLQPGDRYLITKGTEYKLAAKNLRRLAIQFDQEAPGISPKASGAAN
jgi:mannose-6-phosphate isomerase-like protein (cupin superfamily)